MHTGRFVEARRTLRGSFIFLLTWIVVLQRPLAKSLAKMKTAEAIDQLRRVLRLPLQNIKS
jgi:hypothetical protein